MLLPKTHVALVTLRDLKDVYFVFNVGPARVNKQAWGPRVPASWFDNLDDLSYDDCVDVEPWWEHDLHLGTTHTLLTLPAIMSSPLHVSCLWATSMLSIWARLPILEF